jgi:hypothetical protein
VALSGAVSLQYDPHDPATFSGGVLVLTKRLLGEEDARIFTRFAVADNVMKAVQYYESVTRDLENCLLWTISCQRSRNPGELHSEWKFSIQVCFGP